MRDQEREVETQAEGEGASNREPDVGLDPRTPGCTNFLAVSCDGDDMCKMSTTAAY